MHVNSIGLHLHACQLSLGRTILHPPPAFPVLPPCPHCLLALYSARSYTWNSAVFTISAGLITPKWICLLRPRRYSEVGRSGEHGRAPSGRCGMHRNSAGQWQQWDRHAFMAATAQPPVAHILRGTSGSLYASLLLTRAARSGSGGLTGPWPGPFGGPAAAMPTVADNRDAAAPALRK